MVSRQALEPSFDGKLLLDEIWASNIHLKQHYNLDRHFTWKPDPGTSISESPTSENLISKPDHGKPNPGKPDHGNLISENRIPKVRSRKPDL